MRSGRHPHNNFGKMARTEQRSPEHHVSHLRDSPWAHPNLFYNFGKLDPPSSFRLLHIIRRPDDADVGNASCDYELIQTTFDQAQPYETLSYVWGTNERSETVTLRDGKLLRITKPLKEALAFVLQQCATAYLWIDQICIDQDDRVERGDQVKIMGRIYSSCSRVLVWLGQMIYDLPPKDDPGQISQREVVSVHKTSATMQLFRRLRKVAGSGDTPTRSFCHEIMQSPWFQRAWIFQEIVLPPSALFVMATTATPPKQALTMSLPDLHAMVYREAMGIGANDAVAETIRIMYRRYNERRSNDRSAPSPIEQTLSLLAPRAETSEELDRLYAFFGLNHDTGINLTPSYDPTLEVAMIDTATSIIEGTCSLDIFEVIPRVLDHAVQSEKIPTWTPDFRREHLVTPFKRSHFDFRQPIGSLWPAFISSTYTYYRGTIYCAGEEKRTIQAHGYVLDQIDTEIGTLSSRAAHQAHLDGLLKQSIKTWNNINRCVENSKSSPAGYKHKLAELAASANKLGFGPITKPERTRLAPFTADLGFAPIPTEERLQQALMAEGCCAISDEDILDRLSNGTNDFSRTMHTMIQVMRGRTLWMTRSGRFALGSHLRYGDHICLAYGCSNPIALRGEHEITKVLGTCFLEGWMDPWSTGMIGQAEEKFDCTVFHII
ncbi:heterokaryon incompatibility protein-domain-containing protein [Paraphoma chrysanthemicola]|nr:heterokaryon incompatibility protein-domain-containing protein [Paraphoma chrysanthemicola]